MQQKEKTFQVSIDVIKNSTCFKAFTITAEVPKIFMQQYWYTIKKVKDSESYELLLANKKCIVDTKVFRKILDICPRVEEQRQRFTKEVDYRYSCDVDMSKESDSEPTKKRTANKRVVKKKVTIYAADNIILDPDVALELGKSISLTKAAEEEAKRQVHATHESIVTKFVLDPARRRPSEQEIGDTMKALKESKKTCRRQSGTRGSSEGTGSILGVTYESTVISATLSERTDSDENKEKKDNTDDDKSIDLEMTDDEQTDDEFVQGDEQVYEDEEEEMTNAEVEDSRKGDVEIPNVAKADAEKIEEIKDDAKKAELSPTSSSLSLRVEKLEKDVSKLKKIDHSTEALSTLKSQVPTVVEHYLGSKIRDDLQKGKKTKRRKTKELETSKKPFTTKETFKGKTLSKSSKTGKSTIAIELVKEPIAEVVIDDAVNTTGEDVVSDDDQPQDTLEPKTYKTLNEDWFKQPPRPPTPNSEWNKHQVVLDQPEYPWLNQMVSATKDPLTFNDLMATPIDFSKYVLNRLKIDNLTQDLLLGPTYNLLKVTCTSSIELEYNFQECVNALTEKLDWNNPERDRYPFDLSKPLPLQGCPCHLTVVVDHFFNNDLKFLKTSDPEKTYTKSIMKTKATRVKSVSVKKLYGYGYLEEIMVKRADRQLYKFKEGSLSKELEFEVSSTRCDVV
uniref:Uncharacterized protein n=1 Tax=Tanacetum cinerariifolium TaxID=118510 RepID=A0A6L2M411_TANCI|nr:hypothetical protein [Tanacetum cinerariifolium]